MQDAQEELKELIQAQIDESMQELAEQVDQNMDFVESKFQVFNKALDLQAANID